MKKTIRKLFLGLFMGLSLVLVACGNTDDTGEDTDGGDSSDIKVGIIFTEAGLGGESFNDLAYDGVVKASEELGVEYDYVEPSSVSDLEILQDEMADTEEYDLIIAVGFEQVDALEVVSANYPEQNFALIDAVIDAPNVASYVSKEEEGSFLIGALSALLKESGTIDQISGEKTLGFIGGVDSPLINKFAAGYTAGAQYIDEDYNILSDYAGGFSDPSTGKVISETMYSQGADIQYHAAGASGMGMFQAAAEEGFSTFGVNTNQNKIEPDHIIGSMLKLVDQASFDAVQDVVNGEFKADVSTLGLEQGGIGYTLEGSNIKVPEDIVEEIEKLKEQIISGELEIPEDLSDVDEFLENNSYNN